MTNAVGFWLQIRQCLLGLVAAIEGLDEVALQYTTADARRLLKSGKVVKYEQALRDIIMLGGPGAEIARGALG
jgi:hypothetical protein